MDSIDLILIILVVIAAGTIVLGCWRKFRIGRPNGMNCFWYLFICGLIIMGNVTSEGVRSLVLVGAFMFSGSLLLLFLPRSTAIYKHLRFDIALLFFFYDFFIRIFVVVHK
jgi:hypothetical protein